MLLAKYIFLVELKDCSPVRRQRIRKGVWLAIALALLGAGGDTSLACSPETAKAIDDEVIATVKAQYEKAMGILRDHAAKLNELAGYLLEKETITGEEFMEILNR